MKVPKVLAKFIIFGMHLLPSESSIHFLLPGMVHHKLKCVIDGGDGSGTRLISKEQLALISFYWVKLNLSEARCVAVLNAS
jgi:hypothetical protein